MADDGFTVMSDGIGTHITAGAGRHFTMVAGIVQEFTDGIGFQVTAGAQPGFTGDLPIYTQVGHLYLLVATM
tara:strand:- start:677 stop:892 length:216 start_codon:yes stop_codon:yes gene_type:complete